MTSVWSAPIDSAAEAMRVALDSLPAKLTWKATVHYYRFIHRGSAIRVLVVDALNWRVGRHVYFVPVHFERDLADLIRRHSIDSDGATTAISELHWSEFERRFPAPARGLLELSA